MSGKRGMWSRSRARRIKMCREYLDSDPYLFPRELAALLGVDPKTVSRYRRALGLDQLPSGQPTR